MNTLLDIIAFIIRVGFIVFIASLVVALLVYAWQGFVGVAVFLALLGLVDWAFKRSEK